MDLIGYVKRRGQTIPTALLRDEGWSLENPRLQSLTSKIRATGRTLRDHVGFELFRGVLTGCNDAFYISAEVREQLILKDPRSSELIKPQLRGQDVGRWLPSTDGVWLLFVRRGTDIQKYPAVLQHLTRYRDDLTPKPSDWDEKKNGKWGGRKSGPYEWYEIQDSTAYYALFERPKIVVQCIGYHSRWALDSRGFYVNNKTFLIPTDDLVLLAVLNSPLLWWYMWREFPHMKDEALSIDGQCVERLPVPQIPQQLADRIRTHTENILALAKRAFSEREETSCTIERLAGIKLSEKELSEIDLPSVLQRLKQQVSDAGAGTQMLSRLESVLSEDRVRQIETAKSQMKLECELSALVDSTYGLTEEERSLVRSTRPPRDPLDVLEAKIDGRIDPKIPMQEPE
jgi:hypothetical protein